MELDQAIALTVVALQRGVAGYYGYDLYPSMVARQEAEAAGKTGHELDNLAREWGPFFLDAAWELCRRGMVRPGIKRPGQQAVPEGGYSLTIVGQGSLADLDNSTVLLLQPGSLAATFAGFGDIFGPGFQQRSQEAIKCRNAEAWLACCAMSGAAAEAILLAAAEAKLHDQDAVLAIYLSTGGRGKIINVLVGQAKLPVQATLKAFTGIISHWRDEASHGQTSEVNMPNADEALRQLLHMCQWVNKEWQTLTA